MECENELKLCRDDGSKDGSVHISFENVSFSYLGKKNNLQDISFSLKKGESLGIIGPTGSGKSTILRLLMRFYDVDKGIIRINGKDLRSYNPQELSSMFGVVLQNDFLYADTIANNIDFGRGLSHEQIKTAAVRAQAIEFIEAFPEGFEHEITSKGTNISGGQKQRLLISRALAGDPEILILDDSSSALDYKTDANLRAAITEGMKNTTSILVAQRISSIKHADLILVLDEGAIIGMGTHEELLNTCDVYREISESQMGGAFVE
jgi:ATP-binding cassette subfamily B protein